MATAMQQDPTRMQSIRRPMLAEIRRRYTAFAKQIKNTFLKQLQVTPVTQNGTTTYEYDEMFVTQMTQAIKAGITTLIDTAFIAKYSDMAYKHGVNRAYADGHKSTSAYSQKIKNPADYQAGNKDAFFAAVQTSTASANTHKTLLTKYTSYYANKGSQLGAAIENIILTGVNRKEAPSIIGNAVLAEIDKQAKNVITGSRDLLVEFHAEAQLDAYDTMGIKEVAAVAEWHTAGDNKVCPACAKNEGIRLPIAKARGMIPVHPNCFTKPNTQIFTDKGWKSISEIDVENDLFLSENPETGETDFIKATKKIEYDYNGNAIEFKGRRFQLTVTANHQMYCVRRFDMSFHFIDAAKIADENLVQGYYLPTRMHRFKSQSTKTVFVGSYEIDIKLYAQCVAVWLLDNTLNRIKTNNTNNTSIPFSDTYFAAHLRQIDNGNNTFVPDVIKYADVSIVYEFLRNLELTNESKTEIYYLATSRRLMSDLCFLILRCGGSPSVSRQFIDRSIQINSICYRISRLHHVAVNSQSLTRAITQHTGKVYCVELEKWHTIYVMENGFCTWTGNCRCTWVTPEIAKRLTKTEQIKRTKESIIDTAKRLDDNVRIHANNLKQAKAELKERFEQDKTEAEAIGIDVEMILDADSDYKKLRNKVRIEEASELRAAALAADYKDSIITGQASRMLKRIDTEITEYKHKYADIAQRKHILYEKYVVDMYKEARSYISQIEEAGIDLDKYLAEIVPKRKKYQKILESGDFNRHTINKLPDVQDYINTVRKAANKVDHLSHLFNDLVNIDVAYDSNIRIDFDHVKYSHKTLNSRLVDKYWAKKETVEKGVRPVQTYSNIKTYSGIVSLDRDAKDEYALQELHKASTEGKLTEQQKNDLKKYSKTYKNPKTGKNVTVSGKQMLEDLATLQEIAEPTKVPLILYRRVHDFNHFDNHKVGEKFVWLGIVSTFATETAFNEPKHKEAFGECIIEIHVPVGSYIIPIGNKGTTWHSLDEIALPARTQIKVLRYSRSSSPPKMIVEVIPKEPVKFRD
ncbi:MAG: hypothetical protein LBP59_11135 [Planctomycetaceae bacterium]|nr:hypothetical protein [Planctomycetaceae bacterium]